MQTLEEYSKETICSVWIQFIYTGLLETTVMYEIYLSHIISTVCCSQTYSDLIASGECVGTVYWQYIYGLRVHWETERHLSLEEVHFTDFTILFLLVDW